MNNQLKALSDELSRTIDERNQANSTLRKIKDVVDGVPFEQGVEIDEDLARDQDAALIAIWQLTSPDAAKEADQ